MICPLLTIKTYKIKPDDTDCPTDCDLDCGVKCLRERCAWWYLETTRFKGHCGILGVAEALRGIENTLDYFYLDKQSK